MSNLPTIAFFAGILRLRLQPGIIPLGPKVSFEPCFFSCEPITPTDFRNTYSYPAIHRVWRLRVLGCRIERLSRLRRI